MKYNTKKNLTPFYISNADYNFLGNVKNNM